jgi:hypothetical protein
MCSLSPESVPTVSKKKKKGWYEDDNAAKREDQAIKSNES